MSGNTGVGSSLAMFYDQVCIQLQFSRGGERGTFLGKERESAYWVKKDGGGTGPGNMAVECNGS